MGIQNIGKIQVLQGHLDSLQWSQGLLSRKIGVTKNTVTNWMTGKTDIPKVVLLYLSLLEKVYQDIV